MFTALRNKNLVMLINYGDNDNLIDDERAGGENKCYMFAWQGQE
jgi:hypothetical protein